MEEQTLMLQEEARSYVESMGKWYKFFGILGIIGAAMIFFFAFLMLILGIFINSADIYDMDLDGMEFLGNAFFIIYAIFFFICGGATIPVIIYLLRASKEATQAVALHDNEAATRFLRSSKSFWKYYGIMCIVLYGLCIIIGIVAGVSAALTSI